MFGPTPDYVSDYVRGYNKYKYAIQTERGRINCIAREIPCDCNTEEKRSTAKSMNGKSW